MTFMLCTQHGQHIACHLSVFGAFAIWALFALLVGMMFLVGLVFSK